MWQQWLEDTFPGAKPLPESESSLADAPNEKGIGNTKTQNERKPQQQQKQQKQKQTLDIKNTAKKFLIDQTFGATANTVAFIAGLGAIKGMSGSEIVEALRQVRGSLICCLFSSRSNHREISGVTKKLRSQDWLLF